MVNIWFINSLGHSVAGYSTKYHSYCKFPPGYSLSNLNSFGSLKEAKKKCDTNKSCKMIYMADIITEYIYYICPLGSQIKVSHKNSKLYIKGKFKDLSWMSTTNWPCVRLLEIIWYLLSIYFLLKMINIKKRKTKSRLNHNVKVNKT